MILKKKLEADMHVMTPSIPSTIPFNTPKTIQTPSSLVDSSLVSYAVLLISNGSKSCLFFNGWICPNAYGSDPKSIHHSYFYTHQCFPIAHPFPSLAPYPHGDTKYLVFTIPYDNIYDT